MHFINQYCMIKHTILSCKILCCVSFSPHQPTLWENNSEIQRPSSQWTISSPLLSQLLYHHLLLISSCSHSRYWPGVSRGVCLPKCTVGTIVMLVRELPLISCNTNTQEINKKEKKEDYFFTTQKMWIKYIWIYLPYKTLVLVPSLFQVQFISTVRLCYRSPPSNVHTYKASQPTHLQLLPFKLIYYLTACCVDWSDLQGLPLSSTWCPVFKDHTLLTFHSFYSAAINS